MPSPASQECILRQWAAGQWAVPGEHGSLGLTGLWEWEGARAASLPVETQAPSGCLWSVPAGPLQPCYLGTEMPPVPLAAHTAQMDLKPCELPRFHPLGHGFSFWDSHPPDQ